VARPLSLDSVLLDHDGPWTEEDFFALPVDRRVELVDGSLLVSPATRGTHQWLSFELCAALRAACSRGQRVLQEVNVRLGPERILIPDIVVLAAADLSELYFDASQVLLVVEIGSPSTSRYDRTVKAQLYAGAGVPHLLRVELAGSVTGVLHRLEAGEYVEIARGPVLSLSEPFPVELDLPALAADED
jgi:Uma2 family endonuclease